MTRNSKTKRVSSFTSSNDAPLQNEDFYYTDASKYAEEHYGEVYRATTGLDNDWGDY